MAGIHAIIGIGEGLITVGALALIRSTRPDLLKAGEGQMSGGRGLWLAGLAIAVALAVLSPLASSHPDGLEWVAEQKGFLGLARGSVYSIIPNYAFPGVSNQAAATIIAGILGVALVLGVFMLAAVARKRRQANQ
jgi:cobalt/nickel transport system permease protein